MFLMLAILGLSVLLIAFAAAVVISKNLVHSVFWLAAMLVSTAGLYLALDAPFLAAIQVMLYTGGVITMMLFGVMLTRRDPEATVPHQVPNPSQHGVGAAIVAGLLGVMLLVAIWTTPELAGRAVTASGSASEVGMMFMDRYLVAFEALSVLLLAGMTGAIVLARRADA